MLKPQSEFPLLKRYQEKFPINEFTIFAYNGDIYCNYPLPPDLIIHEETHLKQQEKYGLDTWVDYYLKDDDFRLKMELEAYRKQLASIKDRELRFHVKQDCIDSLTSSLYGNLLSKEEAKKLLDK